MADVLPYLDADDVFALPPAEAVAAIEAALHAGLDPSAGVPRSSVPLRHGSMLVMPAESGTHAGVKLVTIAPGNAERGLPRINALYTLFDAVTLRPAAILDGTALTTLRTPAVSSPPSTGSCRRRPGWSCSVPGRRAPGTSRRCARWSRPPRSR